MLNTLSSPSRAQPLAPAKTHSLQGHPCAKFKKNAKNYSYSLVNIVFISTV